MDGLQETGVRQRSRMACEACRERKRKCGGGQPCDMCRNFGYDCFYRAAPRKRRNEGQKSAKDPTLSKSPAEEPVTVSRSDEQRPQQDKEIFARSLESNSGSSFVRTFAMTVDASNALPLSMLAWNLFLGERQVHLTTLPQSITDVLSQNTMQDLTKVYLDKVDPIYGFMDRDVLHSAIRDRWLPGGQTTIYDAVLCATGAIGCLFFTTQDLQTEMCLFSLTKSLLDLAIPEEASVDSATAWVLRTIYLRLTARADEAWMSSCTALHMIDAAGLHCEADPNASFGRTTKSGVDPEIRRRVFGVARHLNVWLSFDLGRSRVTLHNASFALPSARSGDYTLELLELLSYSESLDPGKVLTGDELFTILAEVLARTHSLPPSILAQCNLMLTLYRRIYTLGYHVPSETLGNAVTLIQRGIRAVYATVENGSPWHHVANVPFQSICTLLAIDSVQSFSLLADAMTCLENVSQTYGTQTTKDAVTAAQALIYMHQRRRQTEVRRQSEMLKLYPASQPTYEETFDNFPLNQAFTDLPWFNELIPDEDFQTLSDVQPFRIW